MAWNQFPMNQNYNFQQSVSPMQTQNVMQNTFMPIQVKDEAEAKSYPMAAVLLPSFFLWEKNEC